MLFKLDKIDHIQDIDMNTINNYNLNSLFKLMPI